VQDRKIKFRLDGYFVYIQIQKLLELSQIHYFEHALRVANAIKGTKYYDDSLDADVEGALQIGLEAIFFNESKFKQKHISNK
jgi:putative hydrolase of the HAD superfamily